MANIYNWDVIAANNANADSAIDWAEGMSPASVNDSARVMMGRVKEILVDIGGSIVATGTANVIAVSAQSAFTTLANGRIVSFRAIATNTQSTTLNVNATGAKPVLKATGGGIIALAGREIQSGAMYTVQYSTDLNSGNGAWLLLNPTLSATPSGVVTDYAGINAPEGWLLCYGQAVSRTTYADLFAAIGTTYGAGDGSTTFNLPDIRGRNTVGKDNMGGTSADRLNGFSEGINGDVLGATGGAERHILTASQNGPHDHGGATGSAGGHAISVNIPLGAISGSGGAFFQTSGTPQGVSDVLTGNSAPDHAHTITASGTGEPHNNVQPGIVFNKIIKI